MATHTELQSFSRANFIGASPTLTYSSVGNISRHKYLVNLIAVVQDMADVDPTRLPGITEDQPEGDPYSVPPPPLTTQAELLIQEVLEEWVEPLQTLEAAHLAAKCHNPPLHAYWARRPNDTQNDADRKALGKFLKSQAGNGVTIDTLENYFCDQGRIFPAVIATLVANGYEVSEKKFSGDSTIGDLNSPADQAAAWQKLATELQGCFPAVDFDFQQKVAINGYRGDGSVELTQNSGMKQTAKLLFQWRLVEAAFEEANARMAEITAKLNRGKSVAAKAKKGTKQSDGVQKIMTEIYERYQDFITKANEVVVSSAHAPTLLSDTPRVPVPDVKIEHERYNLRDEFGLENITAFPKDGGTTETLEIGAYFEHLMGGEEHGPPGAVKGKDKADKQNILDKIANRMNIIRNKVQKSMLQTITISGDVTIWQRDYTHEFERRRVIGEASLIDRQNPDAWMPGRAKRDNADGIPYWDIVHNCTHTASYSDPKATWVREQKSKLDIDTLLIHHLPPAFSREVTKFDKLGTFTCGKAPEYIVDEETGVESFEDHTLTPFTDPSGSRKCKIADACGGMLPGLSAPLYRGYECKSCPKTTTTVSAGCFSSVQEPASWAVCQDCVLKMRSKKAFSPWGANHARVHPVAAEWMRLQLSGVEDPTFSETLQHTQTAQQGTIGWRLTDEWRHVSLSSIVTRPNGAYMNINDPENPRVALKDAKASQDFPEGEEEKEEEEALKTGEDQPAADGDGGDENSGDATAAGGAEADGEDDEASADRDTVAFEKKAVKDLKDKLENDLEAKQTINRIFQIADDEEVDEDDGDEGGSGDQDVNLDGGGDADADTADGDEGMSAGSQEEFWFPSNISYQAALDYVNSFFLSGRNTLAITHAPQPILRPFTPFKWIWVGKYKRRLWYSERAELFHPMFRKVMTKNVADAFADSGVLGVLQKIFGDLEEMRPGGYTCNLCSKRVEPTKIVKFSMKKFASKGEQVMTFPGAKIAAVATGDESRIERLCQGYFCHHKEINADNLSTLQRCYAVCMECAQSSAVQGGDIEEQNLADDPTQFDKAFKDSFLRLTGGGIAADQVVRIEPLGADGANLDAAAERRTSISKGGKAKDLKVSNVGPRSSFMDRQGYLLANDVDDENWAATEKLRASFNKKTLFGKTEGGPKQYKAGADTLLKQFIELDSASAEAHGLKKATSGKIAVSMRALLFSIHLNVFVDITSSLKTDCCNT